MKYIKIFEMYREDKSWMFKRDVIKKVNRKFIVNFMETHEIIKPQIDNKSIVDLIKSTTEVSSQVRVEKALVSISGERVRPCTYFLFNNDAEDLSWGGIYPPIIKQQWTMGILSIDDDYYIIEYSINVLRNGEDIVREREGHVWVDGKEHLKMAIKDMIQNYNLL